MAAQTISAFTTTQLSDGTYRVNYGFTVADADSDSLSLAYNWKKQSDSSYVTANHVTGPYTVAATPGGVALTGTWDLDADFAGNLLAVPLTLQIVSTKAPVGSAGSLTAIAADTTTGIEEGDTVTIGGRIYEFSTDQTIVSGHVVVLIPSATATAAQVKTALIAAITGDVDATVTATSGAGQLINLASKTVGAASNVAITESISNTATLTPVGLTGGADAQVVSATSNITADTGSGDVLPEVVVTAVNTSKYDFSSRVIEGSSNEYGAVAQGNLFGSYAKKVLNTVESGIREFVRIYGDRNLHNERAVLVNPAFLEANTGSAQFTVVVKPVAWLTDIAARTLSNDKQWANNTIYAVVRTNVSHAQSAGALVQRHSPVLAYLMSAAQFEQTIN